MGIERVGVLVFLVFLILHLNLGLASEFGSKVEATDNDVGHLLEDFNPVCPTITWWDCGTTPGSFDAGDVLYLDTDPLGEVSVNDVRLTPYGGYPAGSKVASKDADIGQRLIGINCAVVYVNLFGGPGYDLEDPVYIKTQPPFSPPGPLSTNDVALVSIKGIAAGYKVNDNDPCLGKPAVLLYAPPYVSPTNGPAATIRFFNANGNLQENNAFPLYDKPDGVYLDISNVPDGASTFFGICSPNDIRLSL